VLLSQKAEADRQLPANQPERGLLYDGLEVAHDGLCYGALRVKRLRLGRELYTHGPDVAPHRPQVYGLHGRARPLRNLEC
jgi:hypothetical protein